MTFVPYYLLPQLASTIKIKKSQKIVKKLSKSFPKVVQKLSKSCLFFVTPGKNQKKAMVQ
jgi:uncharacterized protein YidB (DUF937 family)